MKHTDQTSKRSSFANLSKKKQPKRLRTRSGVRAGLDPRIIRY